jgi:cyclopropane fatty-acyl-phospholipid synthase-like methyltransferase
MTRRTETLPPGYFEALYQADPDPWRFATSTYEQEKYAATLAALPDRRFASGLEIGCSIGILTRLLASRCDHLLAIDVSDAALSQARQTCANLPVTFQNRRIPAEWPSETFDLIVLSEVLYYLTAEDVRRTAELARSALQKSGLVVMVHFLGETDYPLTGEDAANIFARCSGLRQIDCKNEPLYRIDTLESPP